VLSQLAARVGTNVGSRAQTSRAADAEATNANAKSGIREKH